MHLYGFTNYTSVSITFTSMVIMHHGKSFEAVDALRTEMKIEKNINLTYLLSCNCEIRLKVYMTTMFSPT